MRKNSQFKDTLGSLRGLRRIAEDLTRLKKAVQFPREWHQIAEEMRRLNECFEETDNFQNIDIEQSPDPDDTGLSGRQLIELKRLRYEKKKWGRSIEFAVKLTTHCGKIGRPITRKEAKSAVNIKIPETTFDKIWKCLPKDYKNCGGRPKKKI